MLLDLQTGEIEEISKHIDTLVAAYQYINNEMGIILFNKLNFLINIVDYNIARRCDKITIFIPFLKEYHFEEIEYFFDYMVRNDYVPDIDSIILVVGYWEFYEYKKYINKLRCRVVKFTYSKAIPNELGWVIHNNSQSHKGYNIIIKNTDDVYQHKYNYNKNKLNIIGLNKYK